ncbi:uncharacterized protein LOC115094246 isoform X2 [Rhinatrema bivittatum]|uniref:uncharacterized protein LOC115094246 isoform X2 n=1 Tax=Rhinatrema bivittatum TaxID=194408 RepID=UPI001128E92B|nr:uncharacterized protein LOC115094246 isoform X2 [Rhinatrema bivittatum]
MAAAAAASGLGRMRLLLFLLSVSFTILSADTLAIVGPKLMTVQTGQDVWLTCLIRTIGHDLDQNYLFIRWTKGGFDKAIFNGTARYGRPGARLPIEELRKGNASLFLPSVTQNDRGLYLCEIRYPESYAQHTVDLQVQAAKSPACEPRCGEEQQLRQQQVDEESWHRVKWFLQVGMVLGVLLIGLVLAAGIAVALKG